MIREHSAFTEPVRRLDVFTGVGRRRTGGKTSKPWPENDAYPLAAGRAFRGCNVTQGRRAC
jgi:hypothetical protein